MFNTISSQVVWRRAAAAAAFVMIALHAPAYAQINADGAAAATRDLYLKISARDASVLRYVPDAGFSEITSQGERHQLDAGAFKKLFASPLKIDLHAENLKSENIGNAVLVTGIRGGSLTPPSQLPKEERHVFSMLWTLSNGQWQLQHVHLSGPIASP